MKLFISIHCGKNAKFDINPINNGNKYLLPGKFPNIGRTGAYIATAPGVADTIVSVENGANGYEFFQSCIKFAADAPTQEAM